MVSGRARRKNNAEICGQPARRAGSDIMQENNTAPLRVAQILGKMNGAGIEQVVMNYYEAIDRSRIQFDFYVSSSSRHIPAEEIKSMGGGLYLMCGFKMPLRYLRTLTEQLRRNHYDIVHCHLGTLSFIPLLAATRAGVPVRILHNHTTSGGKREFIRNMAKAMFRPFAKMFATERFACSWHAARWIYGRVPVVVIGETVPKNAAVVLRNAIDISKFRFDAGKRTSARREFGIASGTLLFGHVGRFCPQKNQHFLIDIFARIVKQHPNSRLMLVGEGADMEVIRARIITAGVAGKVILAGQRSDVDRLYSAMDCFILPSNYEGLGMVGIEAQCAGLSCLFSDKVPREVKITPMAQFLSLKTSAEDWAFAAINLARTKRRDASAEAAAEGYDINVEAEKLAEYYLKLSGYV